jgi:hypothetical protein
MVSDPDFAQRVDAAIAEPEGEDAKKILAEVEPYINLMSSNVPLSAGESAEAVTIMYAMSRWYGTPSAFLTVNWDDANNPTAIRLCITPNRGPHEFPNTHGEEFVKSLREGQKTFYDIPVSESARRALAEKNPVQCAQFFETALYSLWKDLFGTEFVHKKYSPRAKHVIRKTVPMSTRDKGLYGKTQAVFGVVETASRKSLHTHIMLWCKLGSLLRMVSGIEAAAKRAAMVIDSMVQAELTDTDHLTSLVNQAEGQKHSPGQRPCYQECKTSDIEAKNQEQEGWRNFGVSKTFQKVVDSTASYCCVHMHFPTCHEGMSGIQSCRMGVPYALLDNTSCFLLQPGTPEEMKQVNWRPQFSEPWHVEMEQSCDLRNREHTTLPLASPDNRLIVWEVRRRSIPLPAVLEEGKWVESCPQAGEPCRPGGIERGGDLVKRLLNLDENIIDLVMKALEKRNGSVVDCSPTVAGVCLCNQASYILGCSTQARSAAFYQIDYMTKLKARVGTSLSVIAHAAKRILEYPSIAVDTGTEHRNGMHFLQAALNRRAHLSEVADTQVGAHFLGLGQFQQSSNTQYVHMPNALKNVRSKLARLHACEEESESDKELERGHSESNSSSSDDDFEKETPKKKKKKSAPSPGKLQQTYQ